MPIGKFKEQSLRKKLQKRLNALPDSRTPNSKKIHSVAILTNNDISVNIDITNEVKNHFEDVRNIHIYSYRKYKKANPITYKHFSDRDFYWSGKIKDPSLESFLDNPFDLLIGYFNKNHLYLEFASLKSKADFKIGFSSVNDKIFDLVINNDLDKSEDFINVAKKYLKILNKI